MKGARVLTIMGISAAAAMVLSYVESLIPVPFAVPGIKIGLANIVALFLVMKLDWKAAGAVSLIRVVLSSLLFGNIASLAYSLAGAFLSILAMALLKKASIFSAVGISIAGAVFHNAGQILAAVIIMSSKEIIYWLPALIISGVVSGLAVGLVGAVLIKKIDVSKKRSD